MVNIFFDCVYGYVLLYTLSMNALKTFFLEYDRHTLRTSPPGDSELLEVTANPWDLSRVPGGSSGGSAAAVSASSSVADAGILLHAIAGHDRFDATSSNQELNSSRQKLRELHLELGGKNGILKAMKLELTVKEKTEKLHENSGNEVAAAQSKQPNQSFQEESKEDNLCHAKRRRVSKSQSAAPAVAKQVTSKEKIENRSNSDNYGWFSLFNSDCTAQSSQSG